MNRYTVLVRDLKGNVSTMCETYDMDEAKEDEEILRINNPLMHIWIESSEYWREEK